MFNPLCSLTKPINSTHPSRPSFLIFIYCRLTKLPLLYTAAAAVAKPLQSSPTLCNPIYSNPPSSAILGILQSRTQEWVVISFSNAWKWKVKVKSFSRVWLFATPWTEAYQAPLSMGFSRQESSTLLVLKHLNTSKFAECHCCFTRTIHNQGL